MKEFIGELSDHKFQIMEIISKYYIIKDLLSKEESKKNRELIQLGCFIYFSKLNIDICTIRETPDFIIACDEEYYELEVCEVINKNIKKT